MRTSWGETVDEHRKIQREAIAAAAWTLAREHGPFGVTMSQVSEAAGVSRPTLYKYFPDVESMLTAHHRRHVEAHLAELRAVVNGPGTATERLEHLVLAYAEICHQRAQHGGVEMSRLVHSPSELDAGESQLLDLFAQAIGDAAEPGHGDLPAASLAAYAVRALAAAQDVPRGKVPAIAQLVLRGTGIAVTAATAHEVTA